MTTPLKTLLFLILPVAIALLLLERLLRPNPRERNFEAFTEMVYSKAAETMSPGTQLPGSTTQQHVVPGVVVNSRPLSSLVGSSL